MKAITVEPKKPASARLEDVPEPDTRHGTVLVEAIAVGVDGTDVEIADGKYGWPPPDRKRLVLGHESLGRVLDPGPSSGLKKDDLVVGIVRRPDPVPCPNCAVATGARFAGAQGASVYGTWGSGVVSCGGQAVRGGYASTAQGTAGAVRGTGGGAVARSPNNAYVGKDGDVYRSSGSEWQKYENGAWASTGRTAGEAGAQARAQAGSGTGAGGSAQQVTGDLNRESASRSAGEQRASQWNREFSSRSNAPAARPSGGAAMRGGGMRGGGGRR